MKNLKNCDFDEDGSFSSKPTKKVRKFELNEPSKHKKTQRISPPPTPENSGNDEK